MKQYKNYNYRFENKVPNHERLFNMFQKISNDEIKRGYIDVIQRETQIKALQDKYVMNRLMKGSGESQVFGGEVDDQYIDLYLNRQLLKKEQEIGGCENCNEYGGKKSKKSKKSKQGEKTGDFRLERHGNILDKLYEERKVLGEMKKIHGQDLGIDRERKKIKLITDLIIKAKKHEMSQKEVNDILNQKYGIPRGGFPWGLVLTAASHVLPIIIKKIMERRKK